jgi:hypothetical protein
VTQAATGEAEAEAARRAAGRSSHPPGAGAVAGGQVKRAAQALLWLAAAGGGLALADERYRSASVAKPGVDFSYFLAAARNISLGHSPYTGLHEYVYPPTIALILAPFVHSSHLAIWKVWVAVIVLAPLVAVAVFTAGQAARLSAWVRPVLYAFCAFTVLYVRYWPMSRELYLGQSDTIVLPILVVAALEATRQAPRLRGVWLGIAGLVKGWPAAAGLALFQRKLGSRWQSIVALVCTALIAPLLAVAFGGGSGLLAFFKNAFDAHEQKGLINDSVWAVPQLLFARSGLAHPVLVSSTLRYSVSAVLAVVVVALLVLALRTKGDSALCTWNVLFCLLLLLPVAHRQYALLVLPLLWIWTARRMVGGRIDIWETLVLLVMVLWWLDQTVSWPYTYSPASISAIRYCVPFACDLVACAASVAGARHASRRAVPTS